MNRRTLLTALACATAAMFLGVRAWSQHDGHDHGDHPHDHKGHQDEQSDEMMEYMKLGEPTEHHKQLEPTVGRFDYVTKWRMSSEMPWGESKGVAESKWILGGRFIAQEIKGEPDESMGGMSFDGFGISGYDTIKKKHINLWIDNMSTVFMTSEGNCDESGKVFTFQSEFNCPMTKQEKKVRTVLRIINNNKHVFEMYDRDEDGKEFKSLEVTYTRK